jgi:hypothetical protein
VAISGGWQWQEGQILLPNPAISALVERGLATASLRLLEDMVISAQALPAAEGGSTSTPMLRILLPEVSGPQAITTVLPHLKLLCEPLHLRGAGGDLLDTGPLAVAVSGILTLGEEQPTVVRTLGTRFDNASVTVLGATLDTLSATVEVEADRPHLRLTGQMSRLPMMEGPTTGAVYPLKFTFEAAPEGEASTALLQSTLAFHLRVDTAGGAPLLTASGSHALVTGEGSAQLRLLPQTFKSGGLQPEHLLPLLGGSVSESRGRVSAVGSLQWRGNQVTPDLSLAFDKLSLRHGFLFLDEMTGVLRLNQFWPPRTPKGQQIAIARIQAGLPLSNALATFYLDGKGDLLIEQARLSLAQGTLSVKDSRVHLSPLSGRLVLTVEGVDLGALATYGALDGLTASGVLSGSIPVRLTDSDIVIEHGKLVAEKVGFVRYRPTQAPSALQTGGSVDLLLKALDDFRYERLELSLNGAASGELEAGLHLKGANPALYDGFPVELNLSLSGALSQVLSDTADSASVPERIQKRVAEIMAAPPQ